MVKFRYANSLPKVMKLIVTVVLLRPLFSLRPAFLFRMLPQVTKNHDKSGHPCSFPAPHYSSRMVRSVLFIFAIITPLQTSFAQNIDSLKRHLILAPEHEKADLYYLISARYHSIELIDSAAHFAREGFFRAFNRNDSAGILRMGRIFAGGLYRLGKIDSAISVCLIALPIAQEFHSSEERTILNDLGLFHTLKAEYDEALEYHYRALEFNSSASELAISYLNIGFVHYKLRNHKQALMDYQEALRLSRQENFMRGRDILYINMALAQIELHEPDSAQAYLDLARQQCRDKCSDYVIMHADFAQGVILFGQKRYEEAMDYFTKSRKRAESNNDVRLLLDNTHYLADILLMDGKTQEAISCLRNAEQVANQPGMPFRLELTKLFDRLARAYRATGDFECVAQFQQQYSAIRDTLYGEDLANRLAKIEAEFLERENTAKIARQSEILDLNQRIIRTQQRFNILAGTLVLLGLIFTVFLMIAFKRKKRITAMLDLRVRERTMELEKHRTALLQTIRQHELIIERLSNGIRTSLKRTTGLCDVARAETQNPMMQDRIDRIRQSIEQLKKHVQTYRRNTPMQ